MVFTAGMIHAADALKWGLVNYVEEPQDLLGKAEEIATKIIQNSGTAISAAISCINSNYKDGVDGYQTEITEFGKCFGTKDFTEGTTAFLEKRKANFSGE
jgi:enoyl-CoA hydratase